MSLSTPRDAVRPGQSNLDQSSGRVMPAHGRSSGDQGDIHTIPQTPNTANEVDDKARVRDSVETGETDEEVVKVVGMLSVV